MSDLERSLAKGLCLQLIVKNNFSLDIQRPTIEEAKKITKKYHPWWLYVTSALFFKSSLQKVDWERVVNTAVEPETILEVYNDCVEEKRKQNV